MKTISNEEAFKYGPNDVNIPLDMGQHDFQFTRWWFQKKNQRTWSTYVKPMFDTSKPIYAIQIGVFEFYDAAWLMQQILLHPASKLIGIDPWEPTKKLTFHEYMDGCEGRAIRNASVFGDKVELQKGRSQDILPTLPEDTFDLVVIDGDHSSASVCSDAKNSLRLLKRGGFIVFDDARSNVLRRNAVPRGIEMFLEEHEKDVELLWQHRYADCYAKL